MFGVPVFIYISNKNDDELTKSDTNKAQILSHDTLPHSRLIHKLKSNGICDPILSWIKDFLSGLVQRAIMNGSASNLTKVLSDICREVCLDPCYL